MHGINGHPNGQRYQKVVCRWCLERRRGRGEMKHRRNCIALRYQHIQRQYLACVVFAAPNVNEIS